MNVNGNVGFISNNNFVVFSELTCSVRAILPTKTMDACLSLCGLAVSFSSLLCVNDRCRTVTLLLTGTEGDLLVNKSMTVLFGAAPPTRFGGPGFVQAAYIPHA